MIVSKRKRNIKGTLKPIRTSQETAIDIKKVNVAVAEPALSEGGAKFLKTGISIK